MRGVGLRKDKVCIMCALSYTPTGGKQKACQKCAVAYWRIKHAEQTRSRSRLRKLEAITYLGNKCIDCLVQYHPAVYEFHHVDPKEKDMDGSDFLQRTKEVMFKELNKCVLLCANCHRIRHHNWEKDV